MPKRWGWMVCGFGAVGVGLGALWFGRKPSPMARFADGTVSRVVKVSYGTNHVFVAEPVWKQMARKVLPEVLEMPLGPEKRYVRSTAYDSLALFLDPALPRSMAVRILRPGGSHGEAVFYQRSQGPVLVFTSYPREEEELLVRFSDERETTADVKIRNPHQIRRAAWRGVASRQTNRVAGTHVSFDAQRFWDSWRMDLGLSARSDDGGDTAWMRWRVALLDPYGNWYAGDYNRKPRVPGAQSERQFRLSAEGQEYISAGFVTAPTNEQHAILTLRRRATNWGVQFVALLGPGSYEIKDGTIRSLKSIPSTASFVRWNRTAWLVHCAQPTLFSIATRPVWQLRLRERLPHNKGRVFAGQSTGTATHELMAAQLFTPRLPAITTNLEAEVVAQWPPVEFFIEKR